MDAILAIINSKSIQQAKSVFLKQNLLKLMLGMVFYVQIQQLNFHQVFVFPHSFQLLEFYCLLTEIIFEEEIKFAVYVPPYIIS